MSDLHQQYNDAKRLWEKLVIKHRAYIASSDWLPSGIKASEDALMDAYMKMKKLNDQIEKEAEKKDDEPYDVVLRVLQEHYDKLEAMDKNTNVFGIMQQIRMEQCYNLEKAMRVWKKYRDDHPEEFN